MVLSLRMELGLGEGEGVSCDVRVKVKSWLMHYSNDGPHKDRSTGMFMCVSL